MGLWLPAVERSGDARFAQALLLLALCALGVWLLARRMRAASDRVA